MKKNMLIIFCLIANLQVYSFEKLLDDDHEIQEYVNAFPYHKYQVYGVQGQGYFYIEPNLHDTIKNVLRSGQNWEPHILELIEKYAKPHTVALDIGAHIGTFTIAMSNKVGKSGAVYAFEPQKKIYRELVKNCELNNLTNVVQMRYAVGNEEKIVQMMKKTWPPNEGGIGFGNNGDKVQMIKMDSLNLDNISFVKIDVEGAEDLVIEGMCETILKNKPVIAIEIQGGHVWETASPEVKERITNTVKKIENLNYLVQRIAPHDYLALPKD